DLLAETSLQRALEPRELGLAQRERAGDLRPRQTLGGVLEVCEKVANVREQSYPVGTEQHPHEVAAVGVEPVGADRQKQRFLLALRHDVGRAGLRFGEHRGDLLLRAGETLATLFARSQSVSDLLLPRFDGPHQRRPDKLRAKPDEDPEGHRLHKQRQIDVHDSPLLQRRRGRYFRPAGISGFPNANSIAMPSPMMNDASIKPSNRNTFACSAGIISGWRAAPSRKREHMMPTPTQAPRAPRPIMRPMPIPV